MQNIIGLTTTKHLGYVLGNELKNREHEAKLTSRPKMSSPTRILLQRGIQTIYF